MQLKLQSIAICDIFVLEMRIFSRKALREFAKEHNQSEQPLEDWYRIVKKATWKNLAEARADFPHADLVGICTIFNIGGNKFRLITKINYQWQQVYIRFILTHSEYDRGKFYDDCGC